MSTAQLSRQPVTIPGHTARVGLGQSRPRSTRALALAYGSSDGADAPNAENQLPNNRLDPIDKSKLSLSVLKQYNDLVGEDPGLTCRSLPPVKLSLKLSKTKFVDSPRGEKSSRILKPLLTMKTHTAGHHVFTEGISKKSKVPNPAFALPKLKVPYSNLPDSVTIYKEKNKFAFGVRNETNRTPYRLTPKPVEVPGTQLHITLPSDTQRQEDARDKRQVVSERSVPTNAQQLKSNKIVLDPIKSIPGNESVKSVSNASTSGPAKEPMVPCNSTLGNDSLPRKTTRRNSRGDTYSGESRLSIVSIGDTVSQNYFERYKKQTRKLYPMYDHKAQRDEYVKKAKFGGNYDFGSSKPEEQQTPTFTYKVSSRSLEMASESTGTISPIKNNIRHRPPPVFTSTRGLGGHKRYTRDSREYDAEANYQDQKIRRLYRRMYCPPRSAGSNSSTDMSFLPANPPPSETSHIISEDIPPQNLADFKNEMITLMEERERTLSLLSGRLSGKREIASSKDEDKTFVNPDKVLNDSPQETGRSGSNETDTDIQMESVMSKLVDERGFVKDGALPDHPEAMEVNETDGTVVGPDGKHNTSPDETNETKPEKANPKTKPNATKPNANVAPKQLLSVPTFSLDKLSHHPLANTRERTSLSRSIQNLTVTPEKKPAKPDNVQDVDRDSDQDKLGSLKDCKVAVPVTKLRLFSDSSTMSIPDTPRLSVTDEHGERFELSYVEDTARTNPTTTEKKLVVNSNIQFISPLVSDHKAKRQ